ncbi:MAG: DNA photolyase family protein [Candidatus Obscuribacterales bacterium]|nr:DNA photolyase family protein [Candidatus Obscuribacterales bacterium]
MNKAIALVWIRNDLRLADNPALTEALAEHQVIPVFIYDNDEEGSASRFWLHHSLSALVDTYAEHKIQLVIRKGPAAEALLELSQESKASAIFWNKRYEPWARKQEERVKTLLEKKRILCFDFDASLLRSPTSILNKEGTPYKVFTPFWRAFLSASKLRYPLPEPNLDNGTRTAFQSVTISNLGLLPRIDWTAGIESNWQPGEYGAKKQLRHFLEEGLAAYPQGRDRPDQSFVSRLSPHLHFGEISPFTVWHAVKQQAEITAGAQAGSECFLRELIWREFAHYLLYHFPQTVDKPLRPEFSHFPWSGNQEHLRAWQKGKTGYPIVDAGMAELWATGWMHNRVRMIVASFLVKDLLLPWQEGAKWFFDTLVDADLANNTFGWQWSAGCGADAAPYFRIFNPILQSQKFDPAGAYIRTWIPQLAALPNKWIHSPWLAPPLELAAAGVELGKNYPAPLVDHKLARQKALAAYQSIRAKSPVCY